MVGDYFFLDCANPTLVKLVRRGERKVAVRFSEFEALEGCLAFDLRRLESSRGGHLLTERWT